MTNFLLSKNICLPPSPYTYTHFCPSPTLRLHPTPLGEILVEVSALGLQDFFPISKGH